MHNTECSATKDGEEVERERGRVKVEGETMLSLFFVSCLFHLSTKESSGCAAKF